VSFDDPFAAPSDTNTQNTHTKETPAMAHNSEGKVVVTLKGGSAFDAPWVVIHADDAADAMAQLDDTMAKLMQKVATVAKYFHSQVGGGSPQQQSGSRPGKPAGASQAPGGKGETCAHGAMTYRSGTTKAGKAYEAYFCPEKDRNAQCKPVWL